jgi:4a-hydroxytetrahydrobiopterin dehydratase
MPYADPLTDEALSGALASLPEWTRDGDRLLRTVRTADFRSAVHLVDAVADAAEAADHHPDIAITRYRNVSFVLTTHAARALTQRDVNLAREIERIVSDIDPDGDVTAPA